MPALDNSAAACPTLYPFHWTVLFQNDASFHQLYCEVSFLLTAGIYISKDDLGLSQLNFMKAKICSILYQIYYLYFTPRKVTFAYMENLCEKLLTK